MARSFDRLEVAPRKQHPPARGERWDLRPGDEHNQRGTWEEVLEPHGWRRLFDHQGVVHWCRPGKERGTSATTNAVGTEHLKVHSTSTLFDTDTSYDLFGAYTLLEHAGDFRRRHQGAARSRVRPAAPGPAGRG